jgi:multiple sugar transport system permease protein
MNELVTKKKKLFSGKKENLTAYLFLSPALVTFFVFIGGPIFATIFFLDFSKYNIISPIKIVGIQNFARMFADPEMAVAFINTLKFVVILVPLHVFIALILALLVTRKISTPFKYFYRTSIYFPTIVTVSAVTVVWTYLFNYDFGVLNYLLNVLNLNSVPWLKSGSWALVSVAIFSVWKNVGNSFIFYVIGLQNIPDTYIEAAQIDGASPLRIFFNIKLPLLSPTVFFVLTINLIACVQIFDEPFLITNGGPGDSTQTIAWQIYTQAFRNFNMGYASAIATFLFIIIAVITMIQFSLQNKWVNYDYE